MATTVWLITLAGQESVTATEVA